ncbi:MAG: hypothetical protein GY715_06355, partial [Planctomycetes bacterium]|nr:hypothetical protein [Planctomycetota bacterium]
WLLNRQQDGPGDDTVSGFENTRTRLGFRGHVLDPTLTFFVWSGWGATGNSFVLDAWISKDFENGWRVTAGQFKVMTWREWLVSETRLQLVERSAVTARYAPGYGQGVSVRHTTDAFRFDLAFTDGARTRSTTWNVPPVPTTGALGFPRANEYAFTARAEALFGGTWSQHADYNSPSADEPSLLLGAAAHVQEGAYGTIADETEIIQWTVDASLELDGANLAAAVIGTHYELGAVSRDELAFIVQAGWSPAEDWEVFARYEWGDLDGAGTVSDELSLLTVGFSRFWRGHALKWTTDIGYGFQPVDAAWGSAAIGWRADAPGEDGQVLLRSQMQLLF